MFKNASDYPTSLKGKFIRTESTKKKSREAKIRHTYDGLCLEDFLEANKKLMYELVAHGHGLRPYDFSKIHQLIESRCDGEPSSRKHRTHGIGTFFRKNRKSYEEYRLNKENGHGAPVSDDTIVIKTHSTKKFSDGGGQPIHTYDGLSLMEWMKANRELMHKLVDHGHRYKYHKIHQLIESRCDGELPCRRMRHNTVGVFFKKEEEA